MLNCSVRLEDAIASVLGDGGTRAATARQHDASGCKGCRSHFADARRLVEGVAEAVALEAPSDRARARARLLVDRPRAASAVEVVARLVFDGNRHVAPALARDAAAPAFQMLFCTREHDIDLWQERVSDKAWYIIGQVLPRRSGIAVVPESLTLTGRDGSVIAAIPEESGFRVPSVPPGMYDVRLQLSDQAIRLPNVRVGMAA